MAYSNIYFYYCYAIYNENTIVIDKYALAR